MQVSLGQWPCQASSMYGRSIVTKSWKVPLRSKACERPHPALQHGERVPRGGPERSVVRDVRDPGREVTSHGAARGILLRLRGAMHGVTVPVR